MRVKMIAAASLVGGALTLSGTTTAFADSAPTPDISFGTVSQPYVCHVGIISKNVLATVTGKAAIVTSGTVKTIHLTGVIFSFTNSFGVSATLNSIKAYVPYPNNTSAPYIAKSAKAGTTPAGWTAASDTTGVYLSFPGSTTVPNGAKESTAPLKANYKDNGPAGTVIAFHPGNITFKLTAPTTGTATCKPGSPLNTITSVTE